jgi:mono/diheme cytochrome c family protein
LRLSVVMAAALVATGIAVGAAPARAGSAQAGHALAQVWCSSCHVVDESGQGRDTAPPFATIANRNAADRRWLRGWLTQPHPPMPNFNLSRQQIDDIVAYLDTLALR